MRSASFRGREPVRETGATAGDARGRPCKYGLAWNSPCCGFARRSHACLSFEQPSLPQLAPRRCHVLRPRPRREEYNRSVKAADEAAQPAIFTTNASTEASKISNCKTKCRRETYRQTPEVAGLQAPNRRYLPCMNNMCIYIHIQYSTHYNS